MTTPSFHIRGVSAADVDVLETLEAQVWGALHMYALTRDDLTRWMQVQSSFFIVAEHNNVIVGYFLGQHNHFDPVSIDQYIKLDIITGKGYINIPHDPAGDSLYGISIVSVMRGAGHALYQRVLHELAAQKKKYYFGYVRLAGFRPFLQTLNPQEQVHAATQGLDTVALWYAHECMERIGGKVWAQCTAKPTLALPSPPPDPILSFHVKNCNGAFGLMRVVPHYMHDPASINYSAFLVYECT